MLRPIEMRFDAVLHHGTPRTNAARCSAQVAQRDGPDRGGARLRTPARSRWPLERLLVERVVSVNTAAAGGNASLMTIG